MCQIVYYSILLFLRDNRFFSIQTCYRLGYTAPNSISYYHTVLNKTMPDIFQNLQNKIFDGKETFTENHALITQKEENKSMTGNSLLRHYDFCHF